MAQPSVLVRALGAVAATLLCAACASSGAVPRPFPVPQSGRVQVPQAPRGVVDEAIDEYAVVGTALSLRGVPYRNGGVDPGGFDCSGFTQYVYGQHGVALPREVRDQFQSGKSVQPDELEAGDLLFFTTDRPGPGHVAIAIGGDQFVHAPSSTGVVRVERLSARYWSARFLGIRRVTPP
jgi:cell wall-associated NlpC family hydrolase